MKTPHKHAELIKAWADGAEIEKQDNYQGEWFIDYKPDWNEYDYKPDWDEYDYYRIKPEPKPDWDEKVVLVQEMQRMAKRIEELEGSIDFLSSAYEILRKHNDELMEIQREEIKSKIAQALERNFCPRCGKRLMSALGPVSLHTCCPPQGRTFDDYGNKIS